jgi:hypothetical protein
MSVINGLVVGAAWIAGGQEPTQIDGVSFAVRPGALFVPLREAAALLGLTVEWEPATNRVLVGGRPLGEPSPLRLFDGTRLVPLRAFEGLGATVVYDPEAERATVILGERRLAVDWPGQRVEISLKRQTLRAWQGNRLVLETRISSGRRGHRTPSGSFKAGPYKARMHYSRLYDNSPMPWSVQVEGHVFIHGYASVPDHPASHGCIRVPVQGRNAARWFFDWVKVGTPVEIRQDFLDRGSVAVSPSAKGQQAAKRTQGLGLARRA